MACLREAEAMESLLNAYDMSLVRTAAIMVILALSLNLITGFCGQISLGHAAFMGVGAYTSVVLSINGIDFIIGTLAGMATAAILGVIVGLTSLRVRHDFLAITTMGVVFLFSGIVEQSSALGDTDGLSGYPIPNYGDFGYMMMTVLLAIFVVILSIYIRRSWMGLSFQSIADDEDTARVVGIDVARYKLAAFVLGTSLAGLAGSLYAHQTTIIQAENFGFIDSITVLSMVVVGGVGSIAGVIIATVVLTLLPFWSQAIGDYKLLFYGGLLFVMMRFAPQGLAGLFRQAEQSLLRRRGEGK
jgi:branched-chain amino acid transport system permease protein